MILINISEDPAHINQNFALPVHFPGSEPFMSIRSLNSFKASKCEDLSIQHFQ